MKADAAKSADLRFIRQYPSILKNKSFSKGENAVAKKKKKQTDDSKLAHMTERWQLLYKLIQNKVK